MSYDLLSYTVILCTAVITPISELKLKNSEVVRQSGESVQIDFTLEPPMYPTGIEVIEKTSDSIKIRWNEPEDHVEEFSIITQVESELPNVNTFSAKNEIGEVLTEYKLTDLIPGKNYFLQVSAGSNRKVRQATPVTQVFTCKYKICVRFCFIYVSYFKVSL